MVELIGLDPRERLHQAGRPSNLHTIRRISDTIGLAASKYAQ